MAIDVVYLGILIFAVIKGLRNGLIIGLFSLLGWMIGLAAAMKLSAIAAGYMKDSLHIGAKWLPILSFVAVFLVVMLLVRLGAAMIEKTIELSLMGWANRLGGVVLYLFLYTVIFSIILFFAAQVNMIKPATLADSYCYPLIQPLGPWLIDGLGTIIPFFKDTFAQLKDFFEKLAHKLPQ